MNGFILLSQLQEQRRWDAGFNLAYRRHEKQVKALMERHTLEELREFEQALPFNQEAGRIVRGATQSDLRKYNHVEMALYLVLAAPSVEKTVQKVELESAQRLSTLAKLKDALAAQDAPPAQ